MIYFKLKNETNIDISFNDWVKKIKDDVMRIDKSNYPITVIFKYSHYDEDEEHYKYSHFVSDDNLIEVFVLPGATEDEIQWSFMHEFRHFMQRNIPELYNAVFKDNDNLKLKNLVSRIKELDDDDFYDAFHDFLPHENDAVVFATEKVGKNYRKHPLSIGIKKYIDNNIQNKPEELER
jgi:hypothetical protein